MIDYAELLREAAKEIEMSRGYCDFADELRAAAESLGEPVAWLWDGVGERAVTLDADEADGMWKPLYLAPQPAVPDERTESDYMDDYERGCVDGWNNCREIILDAGGDK